MLRLWQQLEPLAMRLWRVRPVNPAAVLQFGISPYRGPSTTLDDGTPVPKGATILHLHLDNRRVADAIRSAGGNPLAVAPRLSKDLDALCRLVTSGTLGPVVALRGISVHAAMARRFGFEVRPLPRNLRWALVRGLGILVVASYRPQDTHLVDRGVAWPGEIWMSVAALRKREDANRGDP